jgi:hypothetical protein
LKTVTPVNPTLKQLGALVGEWDVELRESPEKKGRATIEWIDGGAFLRVLADGPDPAPGGTWIVGRDDALDAYTILHWDSPTTSRVYQMGFHGRILTVFRAAPGSWERFSGTVSDNGRVIRGVWETSPDGSKWERDLDLLYRRVK